MNLWFDGHLDLACIALEGRDLTAPLAMAVGAPTPAGVTFGSLAEGAVGAAMVTIFSAPGIDGPCGYDADDAIQCAFAAGSAQLDRYLEWQRLGLIALVKTRRDLPTLVSGCPPPAAGDPPQDGESEHRPSMPRPLYGIILMEGADPIRQPAEVPWWFERGLRAVGLTWSNGTRYAGGNAHPGPLTEAGRELVHALDEHAIIHDLSHLADKSIDDLLELTDRCVIASHSNCRSLVGDPTNQRHLRDDVIREIGNRGGVVGINLFSPFLTADGEDRRATIDEVIAHIDRIVTLMGRRTGVALGSDMDGGFGADRMPAGSVADGQHALL